MKYEIRRFGRYINVVDGQIALKRWLMDNLHYDKNEGVIPESATLEECLELAKEQSYTISTTI